MFEFIRFEAKRKSFNDRLFTVREGKVMKIIQSFVLLLLANCVFAGMGGVSFEGLDGEWTGHLEYANYSDGSRVKLKTVADLSVTDDGYGIRAALVFDDFGKIFRDTTSYRIDRPAGELVIGNKRFEFEEKEGRFIAKGKIRENQRVVRVRFTFTFAKDEIVLLKETGTPYRFRNRYALARSTHSTGPLRVFTPKELQKDFSILKRALFELHPGLYRYNTPGEIERKFAAAESLLKEPMREDKFFRLVAQTISEVKCYHTYPNPIAQTDEVKKGLLNRRNYFPFHFQIVGRRMIVTEDASSINLPRGSEITKINGVPMKEVLEKLLTATFADGKGTVEHRLQTLELGRFTGENSSIFDMIFPLFFPPAGKVFRVEAKKFGSDKKEKFEVLALTKAERTDEMRRKYGKAPTYDDDWKFEIWDDNTGYLKMDNFLAWRLSFKVEPFLAKAFAELRARNVENLIIDIRGSGGGFDGVYREIFRYLSQDKIPCKFPTRYYFRRAKADPALLKYASSWDPSFKENLVKGYPASIYRKAKNGLLELVDQSPNCKPIEPYENNFRGKAYLLVSSNNASAAFTLPYYRIENRLGTPKTPACKYRCLQILQFLHL